MYGWERTITLVIDTKGRGGGKKGSVFLCESGDDKILVNFTFLEIYVRPAA